MITKAPQKRIFLRPENYGKIWSLDYGSISSILLLLFQCGALIGACCISHLSAAPRASPATGAVAMQEVRKGLNALQYNIDNHAQELREASERFSTLDEIIAALRQEQADFRKQQQEQQLQTIAPFKLKIREFEGELQKFTQEVQQIKSHMHETAALLSQYRKSLEEMQKQDAVRDKNIEHLRSALSSLMEAMQTQEIETKRDAYRVKSGDSLEKIALIHNTTVKAIKELNALTTDRIRIGQELKLP